MRDALGLVILAGVIAPAIAAVPGATKFVGLESSIPFAAAWQVWWLGGALGVVVIAPVILSWANRPRVEAVSKRRIIELVLLGVLVERKHRSAARGAVRPQAFLDQDVAGLRSTGARRSLVGLRGLFALFGFLSLALLPLSLLRFLLLLFREALLDSRCGFVTEVGSGPCGARDV